MTTKSNKSHVVSFRLEEKDHNRLVKAAADHRVIGASSAPQFARKLAQDYVDGKLMYLNPGDSKLSPDVVRALS